MKHYFVLEYILSVNTLDKTHLSQKERRGVLSTALCMKTNAEKMFPYIKVDKVL